ncbi:MAG: 2-hydroxyacid dehydrogenase [Alphaproteobacteria bacterium]|nr:2-hydroxyacid dehydrogenase [Alphaproteobacteria bacterium]
MAPRGWTVRFARSNAASDQNKAAMDAVLLFPVAALVRGEMLAAAPRLRLIQKLGAGVDRIDLETCRQRGIAVAKLSAGNAIPVAEHTVLMILAACRRLPEMDSRTRRGEWLKEHARGVNRHIHGKRVGLVGLGAIGMQVARVLSGFGVEIVYYDPAVTRDAAAAVDARPLELDELLATSDIVSLHLPLLPQTAGIIDARRIALLKPDAILVNCARGGLVDEASLAKALNEGKLFAAAIDTFATEPPAGNPLLESDRTVVTPHLAGATLDNFANVLKRGFANAEAYLANGYLPAGDAVLAPSRRAAPAP